MHSLIFFQRRCLADSSAFVFTWQVNTYPTDRGFTAIGTGGDDFVHAMVVAVESVIERQIPEVFFAFPLEMHLVHIFKASAYQSGYEILLAQVESMFLYLESWWAYFALCVAYIAFAGFLILHQFFVYCFTDAF